MSADSAYFESVHWEVPENSTGTRRARHQAMVARRFEELRVWQLTRAFKLEIYRLVETPPLSHDERLASQLREASRSAVSQITEGFGRFDPLDFARFVKMARASLIECKNHLIDAVDRRLISDDMRREHAERADAALAEIGGLLDYLQSPEAKRNAERIRQARFERRRRRNPEPRTPEH